MKTATALSSLVLSLTATLAHANCEISIGRYQQHQQQQAQQRPCPQDLSPFVAIESKVDYSAADLDECLDLYYTQMDYLQGRPETSNNRVMRLNFQHRGMTLTQEQPLRYGAPVPAYQQRQQQRQQQPQQQQGHRQIQQQPQQRPYSQE